MQSRILVPLRFITGVSDWIVVLGSSLEFYVFTLFHRGARLNNLIIYNLME